MLPRLHRILPNLKKSIVYRVIKRWEFPPLFEVKEENTKLKSIRNVYRIGRGPSSSHTIGPERAALHFKNETEGADKYVIKLYESLCKTGEGHGTDRVLKEVLSPAEVVVEFCSESPEDVDHPNTFDMYAYKGDEEIAYTRFVSTGGGDIRIDGKEQDDWPDAYPEDTYAEIEQYCRFRGLKLAEYVELCEGPEIWDFLREVWEVMKQSIKEGLEAEGELPGGLRVQRRAKILYNQINSDIHNPVLSDKERQTLFAYAFAVSEQNADCGTIVTAPTCGSCGILPSVLLYMQEQENLPDEEILKALAIAGLFGSLVKTKASVSGAKCGCQAEVGTACAMAAAAAASLMDQRKEQIQYAAEVAMEHHLGLTCDPICGLVQVPCIERNAVAAVRAIDAAKLAAYLSETGRISFDIVVRTMYETGISMNERFRETAEGGLAKMFDRRRPTGPVKA